MTPKKWLRICLVGLALPAHFDSRAGASLWRVVKEPNPPIGREFFLHFADANHGWVLIRGISPISGFVGYRTTDGGSTWQEMHLPALFPEDPYAGVVFSAYLLTPLEGWVGGMDRIAHTADGGETWNVVRLSQRISAPEDVRKEIRNDLLYVSGIHFWNSKEGVLYTTFVWYEHREERWGTLLMTTSDSGNTWEVIPSSLSKPTGEIWFHLNNPPPRSFAILGEKEIWMYGHSLYLSSDLGISWTKVLPGPVADAYLTLDGKGWVVTGWLGEINKNLILHSFDNGVSWNPCNIPDDPLMFRFRNSIIRVITFGPNFRGWAFGWYSVKGVDHSIILSTDDGINWMFEESPVEARILDAQYIDGVVYVVAGLGIVLKRETGLVTEVQPRGKLPTTWGYLKQGPTP
jgi:photosystem II stability/assembly factor-like uncharacterized protein